MRWLKELLGLEVSPDPSTEGWSSGSAQTRAKTTRDYLVAVGERAGVAGALVIPRPEDEGSSLAGTLHGFPLRLTVTDVGTTTGDLGLRYALAAPYLDLEYDPEWAADVADDDNEAPQKVFLAPNIYVEGEEAEEEAAAFRALPPELQARVLAGMVTHRIRYFRSRDDELDVTLWEEPREAKDAVGSMVATLLLAADVARARGATPRGRAPKQVHQQFHFRGEGTLQQLGRTFGATVAAQVPGSRVVERNNDDCVDVRWTEGQSKVRLVVDLDAVELQVAVLADGVHGELTLRYDPEVSVEHDVSGDDWDRAQQYVFFGPSTFVSGPEAAAREEAAILHAVPAGLLDELVAEMSGLEIAEVRLADGMLQARVFDLNDIDDDGRAALAFAGVLARVAEALPRGAIGADSHGEAVRCGYCRGLWFVSPEHLSCSNCGASA